MFEEISGRCHILNDILYFPTLHIEQCRQVPDISRQVVTSIGRIERNIQCFMHTPFLIFCNRYRYKSICYFITRVFTNIGYTIHTSRTFIRKHPNQISRIPRDCSILRYRTFINILSD